VRVALVAWLAIGPLLAGCIGTQPPPAHGDTGPAPGGDGGSIPAPVDGGNGTTGNASALVRLPVRISIAGPANEPAIAIDPSNPLRVLVGAKDYTLGNASACTASNVWAGVWTSSDGGHDWSHALLPGFPGDAAQNALSAYRCISDPLVAFGPHGDAWYGGLAFSSIGGPLPSPLPPPPDVPGGPDTSAAAVFLAHSGDGGASWDRIVLVDGGEPGSGGMPATRPSLAIGADGTMVLGWSQASPRAEVPTQAVVARSTDNGATWSPPVALIAGPPLVLGDAPAMAALPDGSFLAVWRAEQQDFSGAMMVAARSTDGGQTFGKGEPFASVTSPPSPLAHAKFRVANFAQLAVDASAGPRKGWAYAAWADAGGGDSDVVVAVSRDGGATWGRPASIHGPGARGDQFLPAVTATGNGDVDVLFYDRRADPQDQLVQAWFADSHDGGATWNESALLQVPFDGDLSMHQSGVPFLGDFIGIASAGRGSLAVWTATPLGRGDVFVAAV